MKKFTSACGLDCHSCECYEATQSRDLEKKRIVARKWSKEYEAALTTDDINCGGCMSNGSHFSWCNKCPIRNCVIKKKYQSCAECNDFPCQTTEFLYQAVPEAQKNIERLRSL
ncbi:MAG: DUF3795 domain-containing protein [Candidatus Cloacimonetes bacterium]|nr:DUF3795 domain-containing protein [Candidatus Cloacimonadota bacterium]